jgi:nifR3 family TIM-barrel protein
VKPNLLRAILRAVVSGASPYGVPVTAKFRMGIHDELLTFVRTGQIAEQEGVAAIALHARTAQQHYAGTANWDAIGELKAAVTGIPVLGNGDIWEASDAIKMIEHTGCDGVVIGRGCLGRPWLFGQLVAAFNGEPVSESPALGFVLEQMADHCRLLADHLGEDHAVRDFRKHTSWYLTGYPVGGEARGNFSKINSLAELDDLIAAMDHDLLVVPGGERIRRGHTNGPIRVVLPDGYLDDLDDATPPDDAHVMALSGG